MSCPDVERDVVAMLFRDVLGQRWMYIDGVRDCTTRLGPFWDDGSAVAAFERFAIDNHVDPSIADMREFPATIQVPP